MEKFFTFKIDGQKDSSLSFCRETNNQYVNDFVEMTGKIDTGDITNLVTNHAVGMKKISKKAYWDSHFKMYKNNGKFMSSEIKNSYDSLSIAKK